MYDFLLNHISGPKHAINLQKVSFYSCMHGVTIPFVSTSQVLRTEAVLLTGLPGLFFLVLQEDLQTSLPIGRPDFYFEFRFMLLLVL